MRGHTAACGKDTLGSGHTCEVLGAGLDTYHNHLVSVFVPLLCVVRVEDNLSAGSTRAGGKALGDNLGFLQRLFVKDRVEQFVQLLRFAAHDSGLLIDNALAHQVHGNLHHSGTCTLTVTRLQEPEFALLDGELHILHIFVVVFQFLLDGIQFVVEFGHSLFHTRILACTLFLTDTLQFSPTVG